MKTFKQFIEETHPEFNEGMLDNIAKFGRGAALTAGLAAGGAWAFDSPNTPAVKSSHSVTSDDVRNKNKWDYHWNSEIGKYTSDDGVIYKTKNGTFKKVKSMKPGGYRFIKIN